MSRRNYTRDPRATEKRIRAMQTIIDAGGRANLDDIQPVSGFSDVRVLLLSLAECALWGLIKIDEGKVITITNHGRDFYNINKHYLQAEARRQSTDRG